MIQEEYTILIEKFIHHELSEVEAMKLLNWLENDHTNIATLRNHIEINFLLQKSDQEFDTSEAYSKIDALLEDPKLSEKFKWSSLLKYAAIFIGIFGAGFYFFNTTSEALPNFVTLELENGEVQKIEFIEQKTIISSNGEIIVTKGKNSLKYQKAKPTQELVYNKLRIPYGKTFELVLSDGSKIILNSGTTIKYPICFLPNKKREVFLSGEAYFMVAEDSLHQFVVNSKNQQVMVYGTKFNVSAYENEETTRTVLVEGSVGVSNEISKIKLNPGEMAIIGEEEIFIEVKKVDPSDYIAWTQNETVFVSERFSEIIKTLERKFDVTIINEYEALNDQIFTASFQDKSITEILELFSKSRPFHFSKKENKITITKQE